MRNNRFHRAAGLFLTTVACVAFLPACGSDNPPDKDGTFFSPSEKIGNGIVKTYVSLDKDGNPTEVGVRMSESALDALPTEDAVPPRTLIIALPDQASASVLEFVTVDWNSHGHEPAGLFDKPHFDIHFYMTDEASRTAIDPARPNFAAKAARLPDPKYVPRDYVLPGPPEAVTLPAMGTHWADSTIELVPGRYDLQQVLANGSWDGTFTFVEPMITRAYLLTKPALTENIKQPAAYQQSRYYPTTYRVTFDNETREYVISLGGLTMRQAS